MSLLHFRHVEAPERYYAELSDLGAGSSGHAWRIMDRASSSPVDIARTASGARYEVDLLNAGLARIDRHACIGCRVVAA